jgi:SpoVK/Ycf46/Vps4 family AAA+-type ATPase
MRFASTVLKLWAALARAAAPTIVVIENIDVLAPRRNATADVDGSSGTAAFNRILSTLLIELDGVVVHNTSASVGGVSSTRRGPIFVVATTSDVSRVDSAIMRPGRLELAVKLTLPDVMARKALLDGYVHGPANAAGGGNSEADEGVAAGLSKLTEGWSAADLQGLCQEAAFLALREQGTSRKGVVTSLVVESRHYYESLRLLQEDCEKRERTV